MLDVTSLDSLGGVVASGLGLLELGQRRLSDGGWLEASGREGSDVGSANAGGRRRPGDTCKHSSGEHYFLVFKR